MCDAQVVVVKAPADAVEVGCGGAPLLEDGAGGRRGAPLDASLGDGPQLGKRYADDELGLELLCTRAGHGRADRRRPRRCSLKGAKPLPVVGLSARP